MIPFLPDPPPSLHSHISENDDCLASKKRNYRSRVQIVIVFGTSIFQDSTARLKQITSVFQNFVSCEVNNIRGGGGEK